MQINLLVLFLKIFFLFFFLSGWCLQGVQIVVKALNDNPTEVRFVDADLKIDLDKNIFSTSKILTK